MVKSAQSQTFCKEIEIPKKKKHIPRISWIYGLDLCGDGSLRLGGRLEKGDLDAIITGRLQKGDFDASITYPVKLPKSSCMSVAIIRCCHKNVAHARGGLTLNELRQCGLRIVSTCSVISSLIH